MVIPYLSVAISDASWGSFPDKFSPVSSNFEAVRVISSLVFVAHKTEECHVHRSCTKLEGFKVEAEVLAKTMKNLSGSVHQCADFQ